MEILLLLVILGLFSGSAVDFWLTVLLLGLLSRSGGNSPRRK